MKVDTSDTRVHAVTLRGYASQFLESVTIGCQGDVLKSDSPNEKGYKKFGRGCSAPKCVWISPPDANFNELYESFRAHKTFGNAGEDDHYYHLVYLYRDQPTDPDAPPIQGAQEAQGNDQS